MAKTSKAPEPTTAPQEVAKLTVERRLENVETKLAEMAAVAEKKPTNIEEKIQHFKEFAKGLSNGEKVVFANFLKSKDGRALLSSLKKNK